MKFEFLFSARAQFEKELADEVRLIGRVQETPSSASAAEVRRLLHEADLLLAHLVLRPFLDAYHIVADRLAAYEDESFDEEAFLAECLQVGKQWELQRRIASAESRSMELFKTALRLARHRELVDGADTDIARRRREFADEIATAIRRVNTIAERVSVRLASLKPADRDATRHHEIRQHRWRLPPTACRPAITANSLCRGQGHRDSTSD